MNHYSWITYTSGLQFLLHCIPHNHFEYEHVCALQTRMLQNSADVKAHGDTETLQAVRKQMLADLEKLAMQFAEKSFIEICRTNCCLFRYLVHVYETAYYAHTVFEGDRVWPDQCRQIISDFRKRPAWMEAAKEVAGNTWPLSHIDERATKLIQLIEEYEHFSKLPSRNIGSKQEEVLRHLKMFVEETQNIENESFKELLEWYQETVFPAPTHLSLRTTEGFEEEEMLRNTSVEQTQQEYVQQQNKCAEETSEQITKTEVEESAQKKVDQSNLREAILKTFDEEELRILCADISEILRKNKVEVKVSLEILKGETLRGKVQSLIDYLDRRGHLLYLIEEIQRQRSHIKF